MVTASYAPDFERCRLLCETLDRRVSAWRITTYWLSIATSRCFANWRRRPHRRRRARPAAPLAARARRSDEPVSPPPLAQFEDPAVARLACAAASPHRHRCACGETCWSSAIPTSPSSSRSICTPSGATARCGCSAATTAMLPSEVTTQQIWSRNAGSALGIDRLRACRPTTTFRR